MVLSLNKDGNIKGAWPFFIKQKFGFHLLTMPWLTPYLGPIIAYPSDLGTSRKTSYEKQVIEDLLEQLPQVDHLLFQGNPHYTNWLPFHWKGFEQSTRYTYVLPKMELEDAVSNYKASIRRELKKGESHLTLHESANAGLLHQIKLADFKMKGLDMFYTEKFFQRIGNYVEQTKKGQFFEAKNGNRETIASMLFLWDEKYLYYHTGAVLPEFRNSGAMTLLMHKGIELACEKNLQFNFEGSMVESIERYFSSFGAEQLPYFTLSKTNSKLYQLIHAIKP